MARRDSSTEERQRIHTALEELTKSKRDALVRFSGLRSSDFRRMGVSGDAEDVVHDVLLKAWRGTRCCAREVDLGAFFSNCIKSVANQHIRKAYADAAKRDELRHYHASCSGLPGKGREIARNIDAAVAAELGADDDALKVLDSMLDERPPREACQDSGMAAKAYNTARKRIQRRARHAAAIARAGFGRGDFSRRPS